MVGHCPACVIQFAQTATCRQCLFAQSAMSSTATSWRDPQTCVCSSLGLSTSIDHPSRELPQAPSTSRKVHCPLTHSLLTAPRCAQRCNHTGQRTRTITSSHALQTSLVSTVESSLLLPSCTDQCSILTTTAEIQQALFHTRSFSSNQVAVSVLATDCCSALRRWAVCTVPCHHPPR